MLASWPGFYPRSIAVEGNSVVSTADILARAQIAPRENIWLQSTTGMQARIQAIPYIATATIHRVLPGNVTIVVEEREPFATVIAPQGHAIVDSALRVLASGDASSNLPELLLRTPQILTPGSFLADAGVIKLRDDALALQKANVVVRRLRYDRFGELVAELRSGINVLLGGPRNFAEKIALIDPIVAQISRLHRPIAAIDLRAPTAPVVVYR
ncbi:MAG: cell division protein FtsQ/DivIB [Vulcanimicrobiaceae bacterium]